MRVFGWLKVIAASQLDQEFASYGPDVNDQQLTVKYLLAKAKNRQTSIKQFIMDNFDFNLDLETWGLTTKEQELSRFSPFMNEKETSVYFQAS